jgi:hypothetical protein
MYRFLKFVVFSYVLFDVVVLVLTFLSGFLK